MVPFPPGGAADGFARLIGQKLSEAWSQPVVVENKAGAAGQIATQAVATAPADGHMLLVVTVGHAVNPSLFARLPYDTEKDLKRRFNVRAQSTLVVLRGQQERARVVGDSTATGIRDALKSAL